MPTFNLLEKMHYKWLTTLGGKIVDIYQVTLDDFT